MRYPGTRQAQHLLTPPGSLSCSTCPVFTQQIDEKFLSPTFPLASMLPAGPSGQWQNLFVLTCVFSEGENKRNGAVDLGEWVVGEMTQSTQ